MKLLPIVCIMLVTNVHGQQKQSAAPPQLETVLIQGASFTMGTPFEKDQREYHDDEAPQTVVVNDFRIGKFPVTASQMCAFLNSERAKQYDRTRLYYHLNVGKYSFSTIELSDGQYRPREGAADSPANQVTWLGAVTYCHWLSAETGKRFRLPSEAEWELAARGPEGRRWPWGNEDPGAKHGERYDYKFERAQTWCRIPVGSYHANATPDGVHDMLGFILGEWCANKYVQHPTPEQLINFAIEEDDERTLRVVRGYYHRYYSLRGGLISKALGWDHTSHWGRPWTRVGLHPVDDARRSARHGFRVVEEIPMNPDRQ